MTNEDKRLILKRELQDRKEYEEFLKWVDEHNPDGYMPYKEWQHLKYEDVEHDTEVVWRGDGEEPGGAA